MITFRKLRWKNFLSTGDNWTEIDFRTHKSTLIIGGNGTGKSTMLDALSFALFGKAHRAINKPQLVNSVNNKGLSVEVEFTVGSSEFKVTRGLKPAVFEIWKNGEMLNQEADARSYQKILEQSILKLNHKSFHQIVVLGSSNFVPFMQLSASNRREVIEDLLDISVFSSMNNLIKEKIASDKNESERIEYEIHNVVNMIEMAKRNLAKQKASNEVVIQGKEEEISDHDKAIEKQKEINQTLTTWLEKAAGEAESSLQKASNRKVEILHRKRAQSDDAKKMVKENKFYQDHKACPTCEQEIEESFRTAKIKKGQDDAAKLQVAMGELAIEGKQIEAELTKFSKAMKEVRDKQNELHSGNAVLTSLYKQIELLRTQIEKLKSESSDVNETEEELVKLNRQCDKFKEDRLQLNEESTYKTAISEMLKDSGIKTKVIKQFLPAINRLINQYLQTLEFFVYFELSETFNETIRSRHRDAFSYSSFSEGEKQRIDLALLFTWRAIAKMKNSVSTNLLLLDETFDSSLDSEGVDNLMRILESLDDNTNVFVISHKGEILEGKFDRKIEFVKEKNFSSIAT